MDIMRERERRTYLADSPIGFNDSPDDDDGQWHSCKQAVHHINPLMDHRMAEPESPFQKQSVRAAMKALGLRWILPPSPLPIDQSTQYQRNGLVVWRFSFYTDGMLLFLFYLFLSRCSGRRRYRSAERLGDQRNARKRAALTSGVASSTLRRQEKDHLATTDLFETPPSYGY